MQTLVVRRQTHPHTSSTQHRLRSPRLPASQRTGRSYTTCHAPPRARHPPRNPQHRQHLLHELSAAMLPPYALAHAFQCTAANATLPLGARTTTRRRRHQRSPPMGLLDVYTYRAATRRMRDPGNVLRFRKPTAQFLYSRRLLRPRVSEANDNARRDSSAM